MASREELVDLSLFAESPTNDWRFTAVDEPSSNTDIDSTLGSSVLTLRQDFQLQRYAGSRLPSGFSSPPQRNVGFDVPPGPHTTYERRYYDPPAEPVVRPLPRSCYLKPLPALPPKKLCKSRPSRTRTEAPSRCILNRLKKTRSEDLACNQRCSLQQRRKLRSTPQLTLTESSPAQQSRRRVNEMVWLPDEQMWLVMNQPAQDLNSFPPQYSSPHFRPQPSPSVYSYPDTTPPLTPDGTHTHDPFIDNDGLSPIQSQFRSLIIDEERRSPLFHEATQTIQDIDSTIEAIMNHSSDDGDWPQYDPAMYDSPAETLVGEPASPASPHTPQSSFDDIEREWNSAVSIDSGHERSGAVHSRDTSDQSYHSAVSSMGLFSNDEDPVDFYLGNTPVWAGIAKSISGRTSSGTSLRSEPASALAYAPSVSSHGSRYPPSDW